VEPTLNMFYQLGAKAIIEDILVNCHGFSRNRQQDINKELAREGSLTGAYSTLDLSMASDSLSLDLMKKLLPKDIFDMLDKIRSHVTDINGTQHTLGMISTMGNGFTFPLMTLIFTCMVKAALQLSNKNNHRFAVFGDDIIVPSSVTPQVIFALRKSGFSLNLSKSFTSGFFRESCGGDFYKGHDVRGIFLKEFSNEAHVYSLFNRLHMWSIRNGIPLFHTLQWLRGLVDFRPVPCHESYESGFIITSDHLTSPKRNKNGSYLYRALIATPRRVSTDDLRNRNENGLLVSFIGGYIRDYKIALPARARFKLKRRTTPNWDSLVSIDFAASTSDNLVYKLIKTKLIPGLTIRELSVSWQEFLNFCQVADGSKVN